ncbi:hypothetical protein DRN94_003310 [archaeon]|nr:hypothetical protein [archaeon]
MFRARRAPRELRRLLQRLGASLEEISDVVRVRIETRTKVIEVTNPHVTLMRMRDGVFFQILAENYAELPLGASMETAETAPPSFTDEDVEFVMLQTGVNRERAEAALREAGGDIAKAILLLRTSS